MQMARVQLIQPFPPDMVAPALSLPGRDAPAMTIAQRRRQVLAELARLKTHSHKRAQLMGRLRELTLAELREGLR